MNVEAVAREKEGSHPGPRSGKRPLWWNRRFAAGLLAGLFTGFATSVLSITIILRAPAALPSTLQTFFDASVQVDASFLLAVFVVASFLLPRMEEPTRSRFMSLLTLDASIFFVGLLESVYGVLLLFTAENAGLLVAAILVTWFLGFSLLLDSVWRSSVVRA